jgi:hypothetical protein
LCRLRVNGNSGAKSVVSFSCPRNGVIRVYDAVKRSHYEIKFTANSCIALSNSVNAVRISSARTIFACYGILAAVIPFVELFPELQGLNQRHRQAS